MTPDGKDSGAGTPRKPISLSRALSTASPARPGDTIWLHRGTYPGAFTSALTGQPDKPIIVRQWPGERVTIDCPATNGTVVVQSNYFAEGSVAVKCWTNVTFTDNTFAGLDPAVSLRYIPGARDYLWDRNHYLGTAPKTFDFNGTNLAFGEWQAATGYDLSSQQSTNPPPHSTLFVRPNLYETNRANIIIFNPSRAASVPLDLSAVLSKGTAFELRNSQDFFGPPVVKGRYDGHPIQVPMTGLTSARPVGSPSPALSTLPDFNVFILLPAPN